MKSDRLRAAIEQGFADWHAGTRRVGPRVLGCVDCIRASVSELATAEASEYDGALQVLKDGQAAAWLSIHKLFPGVMKYGPLTLATAISCISVLFSELHTNMRDLDASYEADEAEIALAWKALDRASNGQGERPAGTLAQHIDSLSMMNGVEIAALKRQVQALKAEKAALEKRLERQEKPGFQTILKAIAARCMAAKEQADFETVWKLEALHNAAAAMLLPSPEKPTVTITTTWPPPLTMAELSVRMRSRLDQITRNAGTVREHRHGTP